MNKQGRILINGIVWSTVVTVSTVAGLGVVEEDDETQRSHLKIAAIRHQLREVRTSYVLILGNIWKSADVQKSVKRWSGDTKDVSNIVTSIKLVLVTNHVWVDTLTLAETDRWFLGQEIRKAIVVLSRLGNAYKIGHGPKKT